MEQGKIYWLVSYPKSGNTWCRVFLTNYLQDAQAPVSINELHDIPIASQRAWVDRTFDINSAELTEDEAAQFRLEAFRLFQRRLEDLRIIKAHESYPLNPERNFFLDEITAGVVYIVRNPLDVVSSLANHMNVSTEAALEYMADDDFCFSSGTDRWNNQFPQRLLSWSGHVRSWLEHYGGRLLLVRYEDLQRDPQGVFGGIIRFLGLPLDDERLDRAIRFSSFSRLKAQEQREGFWEKAPDAKVFFRAGQAGGWRRALTDGQSRRIRQQHGAVMRRLNYADED